MPDLRPYRVHRLLAIAGFLAAAGTLMAQAAPNAGLAAQDAEFQKLYQQINSSIVRVTVVQDAMAIVRSEGLTDRYETWLRSAGDRSDRSDRGGRPRSSGGDGRPAGSGSSMQGRNDGGSPLSGGGGFARGGVPGGFGGGPIGGGPGGGMGGGFGGRGGAGGSVASLVRGFYLDLALRTANPDDAAHYRAQALRVQINPTGFQGDMLAAVLNDKGCALLLGGVFRESQSTTSPMKVVASTGAQTEATFVGANLFAGFTVIQLKDASFAKPAAWTKRKLVPGQTLLPVTFGQPFAPLVHVLARPGEPFSEDRLPPDDQTTPRFERGGAFLFDVEGSLAAVVTAGGGWAVERFALSGTRMQRDVAYILTNQKDIEPRSLGVDFTPLAPPIPSVVGTRRAVQVKAVTKGSLAARAKLQQGDILVSIDGRPMSELVTGGGQPLPGLMQLQVDLVTRTGNVPLEVIRDGKLQTLQMPLQ
jgi:hypothetical protein